MDRHLDSKTYQAWYLGKLSREEEASLHDHLAAGECQSCEQFLETLSAEEEKKLLALLCRSQNAPELPASMESRVLEAVSGRPPMIWFWRTMPVAAAALLAFVFFFVKGLPTSESTALTDSERTKGANASDQPVVTLSLGKVSTAPDGRRTIQRVGPEESVSAKEELVFQVTTDRKCLLGLYRIDEKNNATRLFPEDADPLAIDAGTHVLPLHGRPAGLSLSDLSGEQRFLVLCVGSASRLPDNPLPLVDPKDGKAPHDMVELTVAPREEP
jgi:hypothetical protein